MGSDNVWFSETGGEPKSVFLSYQVLNLPFYVLLCCVLFFFLS